MSKYVALLRGVNVGGRVIKMAELKACLENAGLQNVKTVLLTKTYNYPAKVQILTQEKLQQIVKAYPFNEKTGHHSYIIFIENGLEKNLAQEFVKNPNEAAAMGQGVVYWQVERGQTLKSSFAKNLGRAKYKNFNTNRNLNTLNKLV
jgi:uncharacterized protein (DUF1697 family)